MIFAVANQKGGVGKTTTAVSLGHGLAQLGLPALIADLDSQGHVSASLGLERGDGLYQVMVRGGRLADHVIASGRAGLDVLPGDKSTAAVKTHLVTAATLALANGETDRTRWALAEVLEPARAVYQSIILDCAPSLDILNVCAMTAADAFVIPVAVNYLDVDGMAQYVESLQKQLGMSGQALAGRVVIVPTMFDAKTRESRKWLDRLRDYEASIGALVTQPAPRETAVREATTAGRTVFEAGARAAEAYAGVLAGVLDMMKTKAVGELRIQRPAPRPVYFGEV